MSGYRRKSEKLEKNYQALCAEYADAVSSLKSRKQRKTVYEQRYQKIISKDEQIRNEQDELRQLQDETVKKKLESVGRIMSYIRRPYNLQMEMHIRLQGLWQNMQTLRLPRNVAKEFFNELAHSEECVCGREIGETERESNLCNLPFQFVQSTF